MHAKCIQKIRTQTENNKYKNGFHSTTKIKTLYEKLLIKGKHNETYHGRRPGTI